MQLLLMSEESLWTMETPQLSHKLLALAKQIPIISSSLTNVLFMHRHRASAQRVSGGVRVVELKQGQLVKSVIYLNPRPHK